MAQYYAGIGSRKTPLDILNIMTQCAEFLSQQGYVLRSGGANGADSAFAKGSSCSEIYVPWDGYEGYSMQYPVLDKAFDLAQEMNPHWERLSQGARKLHARNTMQILGPYLDSKSQFVVCWTPDACTSEKERTSKTGGTGSAITLASRNNIPVFNLAREDHLTRILLAIHPERKDHV